MKKILYILITAVALLSCTGRGAIVAEMSLSQYVGMVGGHQHETVVDALHDNLSACGLQGETISLPPCISAPAAHTSVPAVKNHRTNVLQSHGSLVRLRMHSTSHYSTKTQFAKAGLAFVSPRACTYFIYALRRMRC